MKKKAPSSRAAPAVPRQRPTGEPGAPLYEVRARRRGPADLELELWQLPAPATPHLKDPRRIAGLHGRNLSLVEHRLLKRLRVLGMDLGGLKVEHPRRSPVSEDAALNLGLLFRVLAPMRHRENMRACAEAVEHLGREECAYWLGMAMHRKNPRRILQALRIVLMEA